MPNTIASIVAQVANSSVAGIRSFNRSATGRRNWEGGAELELRRVGEIASELPRHRIVQAERFSDFGALGGRGVDGDDLVDRIARESEHRKRDDSDGDHDADGLDCPAKSESEHLFLSLIFRGGAPAELGSSSAGLTPTPA